MILRMTFAARIGLIVVVGLGMAWISTIALYYIARAHTAESNTLPVPGHIAALVELIERTPSSERKLVLRVASSETFAARIDAGANTGTTAPRILPRLNQRAIESALQALGGRPISVNFADTGERRPLFAGLVSPTVDVRVGLRTGDTLVIEVGNALLLGPLGLPVGFGAGIFGTLIALLALLVMHRETKPLARLAEAVDRVDLSLDPVALPEARRSAPEIRSLIDAFNRLQGRLGELLRSRMAMLGGISHDVRTYATRLRLRAEKINDAAERDRAIADINDMILLLDDALLASRAGAGELAEEMVEIDDIIRAEVADRRSGGARIDYQGGHRRQGLSADGRRRRRGNPARTPAGHARAVQSAGDIAKPRNGRRRIGPRHRARSDRSPRRHPVDPASSIGRRQDLGPASAVSIALIFRMPRPHPEYEVHGNSAICSSPMVSGNPSIRFMFWIACPAEPFTRLSSTEITIARFLMRSANTPICA